MYCIECGAEGDALIGSLCSKCFLKRHPLVTLSQTVDITVCAHCGSLMKGNKVVEIGGVKGEGVVDDPAARDIIARASVEAAVKIEEDAEADLDISLEELDERNMRANIVANMSFQGQPIAERALTTVVRFKNSVCVKCSRQKGFYFEAVLQLRADGRALEDEDFNSLETVIRSTLDETKGFISKVEHVRGGYDYYLSATSDAKGIALRMAKDMGAKVTESNSLVGRKDGNDMYRLTYAVRLPAYRVGDFFVIDDSLGRVTAVSKGRVTYLEVMSGRRMGLTADDMERKVSLIGGRSHLRLAVVVSMSKDEVQVMDPDDFKTLDLKRPPWLEEGINEVEIVKYEGTMYLAGVPGNK